MKQILVQCRLDGTVTTNIQYLNFDSENLATKVVITYPTDFSTYTKQLDLFIGKDKTTDFKVGTTSNTFEVSLEESHLKGGYLRLQPIAYLDLGQDIIKVKWEVIELKVKKSLNVLESDASVTASVAYTLQNQIDLIKDRLYIIEELLNI